MFACGGKKKSSQQQPVQLEEKCKEHGTPFEFISIGPIQDKQNSIRACGQCKASRIKEQFITYKEMKDKIISQEACDLVGEFKIKFTPIFNETEQIRKKLILLVDEIHENLIQAIQELFTINVFKKLPNQLFNSTDIYELIQPKTIDEFNGVIDQQIQLTKAEDVSIGLLAKILFKKQESQQFLNTISEQQQQGIKKKLEKIYNEINEIKNRVNKDLIQIKKTCTFEEPKVNLQDPIYQFMIENPQISTQNLATIGNLKGLKAKRISQLQENQQEFPPIKSLIQIEDNKIAYCQGSKIYFFDSNYNSISQLDCENDITALCSITLNDNKNYIIASVEENDEEFQLQIYDYTNYEKLKVINAHEKYIWKIINLPKNYVATCSDDGTTKIFNIEENKHIRTIQVHQTTVNDLTLLSQDIIVTVSDDGMIVASNYLTGDSKGIAQQDCEIKCVVHLNGHKFVTGNSEGEICIYLLTESIDLQHKIKIHDSTVRFITRIDYQLFATSSWDGTIGFINVNGEKVKQFNGPQKDFSEPIMWIDQKSQFVGAIRGLLHLYG